MRRSLALALLLISCSATSDVAVRAAASPTAAPTPTATLTRSPAPSPSPTPTASTSGTPTLVLPTGTGGPGGPGGPRGAEPPGTLHYVAIGASDTVGVGSLDPANGSWPSRVAALLPPGSTYRNLGVSGSLAAQAERDQLPAAVREQPTIVTIWLAVNDLNALLPAQTYGASLATIIDTLVRGTSARIFLGNVPDLRAVPIYAAIDPLVLLATVRSYNAQVAAVAANHAGRVVLVDLFGGSAELTTQIVIASDGFHPSDAGYVLIAQRFAEAMRKSGVPLRAGS